MQVTSLLRFSAVCPFLGHSTPASLRALATVSGSNASALTSTAMQCPMMGPKLAQIGQQRGYASVAGNREVEEIHKVSRVFPCADHELMGQAKNVAYNPSAAPSGKCPHAKAAQQAAAIAQQEAEKATMSDAHRPAAPKASGSFDYGSFYEVELEKKHKDK
jgi:5-aminolevulinate synthase